MFDALLRSEASAFAKAPADKPAGEGFFRQNRLNYICYS